MKIAVFGSAVRSTQETEDKARQVGKAIANSKAMILTGGCDGLPGLAADAAVSAGGKLLAYSPGIDIEEHRKFGLPVQDGEFIFVPKNLPFDDKASRLKYRNVFTCADADACIIIGGRIGTMNEFTIMYDMGKIIGVLEGTGGSTEFIKPIVDSAGKDSGAIVIYDSDPKALVEKIIKVINDGTD